MLTAFGTVRCLLLLAIAPHVAAYKLTLHVKAGPDGQAIGDCPFAHAIRLICATKSQKVDVVAHGPTAKPDWLVEEYGGKMPCLDARGEDPAVVTESRVIAKWLEEKFPEPGVCA